MKVKTRAGEVAEIHAIIAKLPEKEKGWLGDRGAYDKAQYRKVATKSNKPVAFIEGKTIGDKVYLNVAVDPEWRSKGIASQLIDEAAVEVGQSKVGLTIHKDNEASINLAEASGFKKTTTKGDKVGYAKETVKTVDTGEMVSLSALITGEMAIQDIPLAPGVDLAALKAGDIEPLEVVVEIEPGKSKRGWNYLPKTLQGIVQTVATGTTAGFLGHQKPEDVNTEFRDPVTHWVGAKWENGKAYFRGVVDKASPDLKRWIKTQRVKQVSIFGIPTLQTVKGETQVVDFGLMSIDWTPLDRNGMPTRVVAVGEMDEIVKPNKEGRLTMTLKELMEALKALGVSPKVVMGEMGWTQEDVIEEAIKNNMKAMGEMAALLGTQSADGLTNAVKDILAKQEAAAKIIGEMLTTFGIDPKTEKAADLLVGAVKEAQRVAAEQHTKAKDVLVNEVVGEMVVAETARPIIKRMITIPDGADKEKIKQIVGEMLAQEDVKKILGGLFVQPVFKPGVENKGGQGGLVTRKASI